METKELNLNEMETISSGGWSWKKGVPFVLFGGLTGGLIGDIVAGLPGAAIDATVGVTAGALCAIEK